MERKFGLFSGFFVGFVFLIISTMINPNVEYWIQVKFGRIIYSILTFFADVLPFFSLILIIIFGIALLVDAFRSLFRSFR